MTPKKVGDGERACLLLLAGGVLLVFAEGFFGGVPTVRDFVGFTFPSRFVWRDTVLSGDFSTWNPLAALGLSRLASPLHGSFYFGHLPLLLGSLETGVVITWMLHVMWAALGGYLLARAVGGRPVAAVLSGALWAFGGFAVSMWWNGEKVLTCAWLPWFALAARRASKSRGTLSLDGAAMAAAAAMICYVGDPFLLFDAVGLATAVLLVEPEANLRARLAGLGRSAAALLMGLGLAAPALVPAFFLRGDTPRAQALSAKAAETWSLYPGRVAELFIPGWFGDPFQVEKYPGGAFADDPTRQALPYAVSIYAGVAVLILAPLVRDRRAIAALGGTALLFFLLALGHFTTVNALARLVVPGLSLLRYPEKHLVVTVGLLGLLSCKGLERMMSERVSFSVLVSPLFLVAVAVLLAPAPLRAVAHRGALHAAVGGAAVIAAAWLAKNRQHLAWMVAVVAVLDLAVAARPFLRWAKRPLFASPFAAALAERTRSIPPRLYRPKGGDFENPALIPESTAQVFGIAPVPGFEPAHSVRLDVLVQALDARPRKLAELLALDAIMLPESVPMQLPARVSTGGWSLFMLPPPPRAWIVASIRREEAAGALRVMASERFEPYEEAVVTTADDRGLYDLENTAKGRAGECRVDVYRRALMELDCDARSNGLLVSSELDADGWSALVDGQEQPMYTANLALRGVRLTAGHHRVSMRYQTPGLLEGAALAALSALALAAGTSRARRKGDDAGRKGDRFGNQKPAK